MKHTRDTYRKSLSQSAKDKKRKKEKEELLQKEWGIPNWRDPSKYPTDWKKVNPQQKLWEFLRRNEAYRRDFKEMQKNPLVVPLNLKGWQRLTRTKGVAPSRVASRYSISFPIPPQITWEERPDNFSFKDITDIGGDIVFPKEPCPFSDTANSASTKPKQGLEKEMADIAATVGEARNLGWYDLIIRVEFDLEYALKPQIKRAWANLLKARKDAKQFMAALAEDGEDASYPARQIGKRKKRSLNVMPTNKKEGASYPIQLLRICDAITCGCTYDEIAAVLGAEKSIVETTIGRRYRAAQKVFG